jgi:hypothetical protein
MLSGSKVLARLMNARHDSCFYLSHLSFASLSLFSIPPTVNFREKLLGFLYIRLYWLIVPTSYLLRFPFLGYPALLLDSPVIIVLFCGMIL